MKISLPPALVLTAGLGTRLAPLSDVRAKPAMPVAGKPMIVRILQWLVNQGVQSAVLNLHHRPETITRYVGHGSDLGIQVRYSWEQTLLGTAGGPRKALPLLGKRFFIINGDTFTDINLVDLADAHQAGGGSITLVVTTPPLNNRYGCALVDTKGWVRGFASPGTKSGRHFIGVQIAEASVFNNLKEGKPTASIGGLYNDLAKPGYSIIRAHHVLGTFHEIGTPADYLATSLAISNSEGYSKLPLGERVQIHTTASLVRTAVWDNVSVGAGSRLTDCVVADGVQIPENSNYERSVLVATTGINKNSLTHQPQQFRAWPIEHQFKPGKTKEAAEKISTYLKRVELELSHTTTHNLDGDASDRIYVRVIPSNAKPFILLVHKNSFDPNTLPFLNVSKLFQLIPIPIPDILDCEADLGILVLEDLGNITLQNYLQDSSDDEQWKRYIEATDLIIRIQHRGKELSSREFFPFSLSFDKKKLMDELNFFVKYFLISHRKLLLPQTTLLELAAEFNELSSQLEKESSVLCHRDFHSRNLMLHNGQLNVIDFQDARMGPDTYDLVSLLRDSYVTLDKSFVEKITAHYLEKTGVPNDESFTKRFDRMSVQRHLKALGTFGYQITVMGRHRYHDAILNTLGYVRESLGRLHKFKKLRTLLAKHLPELR